MTCATASIFKAFAVSPPGFETVTAHEMRALGLDTRPEPGGVSFRGGLREIYRANLWLRTAGRILVRVGEFELTELWRLPDRISRYPWELYVPEGSGVGVRVTSHRSRLYHTGAVSERIAQGIGRRLGRDVKSVAPANGAVEGRASLLVVRIEKDRCTVSIDSSGEHLHRRGYRLATAKAPLRENLAAAMLLVSDWRGQRPLIDPFCGSGTIAIEAALFALGVAPGASRAFAFESWGNFDGSLWGELRQEGAVPGGKAAPPIVARDRNPGAVKAARANAERAGVLDVIDVERGELVDLAPGALGPGLIVANPPYGRRVGKERAVAAVYRDLGRLVAERFSQWGLVLLCPDALLRRSLGLKTETLTTFSHGGIRVELLRTASRVGHCGTASRGCQAHTCGAI
jgi:putative N6-adenine-specific DNA methylase